jgi:aerobic carbon-monoxide dehydrogenase small subunit
MNTVKRTWTINGDTHCVDVPPLRRFLDVLREDLDLKGTKEGCGEGECGACTVIVNGETMLACLLPAGQVPDGATVTTVEGLEKTQAGRVLQQAYMEKGAAQCGFCIPGMIVSSYALLSKTQSIDADTIRESHAGNICRCTGYEKIVEAIQTAADRWPADATAATEGAR